MGLTKSDHNKQVITLTVISLKQLPLFIQCTRVMVYVIICLLWSKMVWFKVITLSNVYCFYSTENYGWRASLFNRSRDLVYVIICLLWSKMVWPKVITLSIVYCFYSAENHWLRASLFNVKGDLANVIICLLG